MFIINYRQNLKLEVRFCIRRTDLGVEAHGRSTCGLERAWAVCARSKPLAATDFLHVVNDRQNLKLEVRFFIRRSDLGVEAHGRSTCGLERAWAVCARSKPLAAIDFLYFYCKL